MQEELKSQNQAGYVKDKESQRLRWMQYLLKQADIYSHFIRSKDSVIEAQNDERDGKVSKWKSKFRKKHDEIDNMDEGFVTTWLN